MKRRRFLRSSGAALAAMSLPSFSCMHAAPARELRIKRIVVQPTGGRRLTPVAPNAYAPYRGYGSTERILRIQTQQGLEGIASISPKPESLRELLGLDPFKLFSWGNGDIIQGPAEAYRALLARLGGADVALLDLLGKALNRPASALLGKPVRDAVAVYDSSLYMEDLLKPDQLKDLAYLSGPVPADPVELVVRKAQWILQHRPEGFRALKIKIGRMNWMESFGASLARDIAVTLALRKAVGPEIRLTVDGNLAFGKRPLAAADYAAAVTEAKLYYLEEMFPEADVANMQELKKRLRAAGNPAKLAAGESYTGGIPKEVYTQRFEGPRGSEPLIDIEQADMDSHGFLFLRAKAAAQAGLGMTMAPHNFGSKMGFYSQVHLGLVIPNWEFAEMDDSEFVALQADGITTRNGEAKLTGLPGLGVRLKEEALVKPTLELKV